jgi:hypothetical protein
MVSTPDRMQLGDAAQRDLCSIWNGPEYRRFRARLASEQPPEICRSCSVYSGTF